MFSILVAYDHLTYSSAPKPAPVTTATFSFSRNMFAKSSELELKRFLLKFVFKELLLTEGKLTYELNFPFSEFETMHLKKIKTNLAKLTNPLDIKGLCGISNQTAENDNQNSVELHISDKKQRVRPKNLTRVLIGDPNEIRTRVTAVKGRCPRPLDDGTVHRN